MTFVAFGAGDSCRGVDLKWRAAPRRVLCVEWVGAENKPPHSATRRGRRGYISVGTDPRCLGRTSS